MKTNIILISLLTLFLFSFCVNGLTLVEKTEFNLTKNIINNSIVENINDVDLELAKIKTIESIDLNVKLINDDVNINSYIHECVNKETNIYCKTQMQYDYIVWFDDLFRGRVNVSSYLKDGDEYIIIFENVLYGKLHIGEHSDISAIGIEPAVYYFPTNVSDIIIDESLSQQFNGTAMNNLTIFTNETGANAYMEFDNTDDFVSINGSNGNFTMDGNRTISVWVKRVSTGTTDEIYAMGGYTFSARTKFFSLAILNPGQLAFEIETEGGSTRTYSQSTETITGDGLWHHVVALYRYDTADANLYIDNVEVTYSSQISGDVGIVNGTHNNYVGDHTHGAEVRHFNGQMNNFLIFNELITAQDIELLFNLTHPNYYLNVSPVANITNPLNNSAVSGVTTINYTCTDASNDGNKSNVSIDGSSIFFGSFDNQNVSFDFDTVSEGLHNITLICTDLDLNKVQQSIVVNSSIIIMDEENGTGVSIDLTTTNSLILLGILAFIYIGLLLIGMFTQSLSVLVGAVIMGIITGIQLGYQYSATLGVAFVFINVLFISTILFNARKE